MTTRWTRDVAQKQQLFGPRGREEKGDDETPTHTLLAPAVAVVKEDHHRTAPEPAVIEDGPDGIPGLEIGQVPTSARVDTRAGGPDLEENEVMR